MLTPNGSCHIETTESTNAAEAAAAPNQKRKFDVCGPEVQRGVVSQGPPGQLDRQGPGRTLVPRSKGEGVLTELIAAPVNLNKHPYYIHWGAVQISAANLIVIGLMVVVFALAILLPFPKERR